MIERALVLWDRDCGLCGQVTNWATQRDAGRMLLFDPYQAATDPRVTPEMREACEKALHILLPNGSILRAGRGGQLVARVVAERVSSPHSIS